MSVQLTPFAPAYFLTPDTSGKQPPISTLELTSLKKMNNPKYLGRVVAEEFYDDSIFAELMAKGNEFTFAANQVIWEEKDESFNTTIVSGPGVVSFTSGTGTFTINAAAIPADAYDIDSERPTEPQWLQVNPGLQFVAFDSAGRRANGKVTSVASDKKSFVASPIGGSWNNLAATNITIAFTGNNLANCALAPCIGYEKYVPARAQTWFKDSACVEYCDETEIENQLDGGDSQSLVSFPSAPEEHWNVDSRLDQRMKDLTLRGENAFVFEKQLTVSEAAGGERGTNGLMTILENKATKYLGKIETKQDLINLAHNLRNKNIKMATLRVSSEQETLLLDILDSTKYQYDPFTDHTNDLFHIGFNGFKIGEVKIIFKRWRVLDQYPNIGARYHWLLIPEGKLRVKFNKKVATAGYLNIGWFGNSEKVFKYLTKRENYKNTGEGKIDIINKWMPIVFRPQDFMIGMTIAA